MTECDCFNTEDIGSVTAYNLGLNSYEKVIEYSKSISKNTYNTILDMLFLDCLLLNTDRHFSNIEFLIDNQTLNIINIAPIFDNNNSLLPRFIEEYETFNRSEYIARDNRTFEELFSLVSNYKNYRTTLIKLNNFNFTKPYSVDISDSRLRFLNQLLKMQIKHLLRYC